ncbi:Crp/Fnr family transcriptional regulator [Marinigracilibium pacificum]|uniref:Crp/Fnr family transcriptional regulator n=1 Tax=Marinigracilibium pacificum TaxID=2729599 RepID=A0A848J8C4_9BACT|nr:Crp/Fnr family transcriptional regulator [Marinigracilibium pacificum]NMM50674.1 Crp/Fnr family transcriptional regulator [Marinigracilibium pacificum]
MHSNKLELLIDHFESYIDLSDDLKVEIINRVKPVTFKKGQLVFDANKICTESHFIQKGILRTFFVKDGKEISEYFSGANEWVNSPKSFMQRTKDIYYIDAIEETDVFTLNVNDLVFLFDHYPTMERYARLSMGNVFGHFLERITSMRFTSAKERYSHFKKVYADIYPRIPLGMVASYLGITQETLSRIRAEK